MFTIIDNHISTLIMVLPWTLRILGSRAKQRREDDNSKIWREHLKSPPSPLGNLHSKEVFLLQWMTEYLKWGNMTPKTKRVDQLSQVKWNGQGNMTEVKAITINSVKQESKMNAENTTELPLETGQTGHFYHFICFPFYLIFIDINAPQSSI